MPGSFMVENNGPLSI